jgi:hypothetical protein
MFAVVSGASIEETVRIKNETGTLLARDAFLEEDPNCSVIGKDSVRNTASAAANGWHSEVG